MLVKWLKLRNIRSYLSEEVTFPSGSLLLSGDIGSGKSTILLAIEFALFGVVRGGSGIDGASLLRHGKSSGSVELSLELEGRSVVIHRELRRTKDGVSQGEGYMVVDNAQTDYTPVELKARVLEMLGYPKSLLTKSKSLIYRYTVYTPQEEMKHILFDDASARLDTLRKVFQIDAYKVIRDNAVIIVRSLKERIAAASAKVEDLPKKRTQLDILLQQQEQAKSSLFKLEPLLEENRRSLAAQLELIRQREADSLAVTTLKAQAAAAQASLAEKRRALLLLDEELGKIHKQKESYEVSLSQSAALPAQFGAQVGILKHHISLLEQEVAQKQAMVLERDRLERSLLDIAQQLSRAQANKESSKVLERNVLSSETCPVCLQPIGEAHKNTFREKVSTQLAHSEQLIEQKKQEQESISHQLASVRQKLELLLASERKLAELSVLISRYTAQASQWGIAIIPFHGGSYAIAEITGALSVASRQIEGARQMESFIAEKDRFISSLKERKALIASEMDELVKKCLALSLQVQEYASLEKEMVSAKQKLSELQMQEKALLMQKASGERDLQNSQSLIDELQGEIARKEEAQKEADRTVALRNWLEEFFIPLMEVIERNVMLRVHREFNGLFQNWFSLLMEDESIAGRLDDTFTPIVEINGYETALESLSGGEKTSCALAYRLALNKVINDVITSIKTRDVLILDEPTDGFSSEQLEKMRDLLEQLNLAQIIIVSHESKIESFVRHVIRIVKEQHISHLLR